MPTGISHYFNYAVHNTLDSGVIKTKYFRNMRQCADYLGVSWGTIFNMVHNRHNSYLAREYIVEKLGKEEKIKRFEMVKIKDEEIN